MSTSTKGLRSAEIRNALDAQYDEDLHKVTTSQKSRHRSLEVILGQNAIKAAASSVVQKATTTNATYQSTLFIQTSSRTVKR